MSAEEVRTPRPWPEGVEPTADQLASFLAICTHGERVAYVVASRMAQQDSTDCFLHGHRHNLDAQAGHIERLTAENDTLRAGLARIIAKMEAVTDGG